MPLRYSWKQMTESWNLSLRGRRISFGFWMSVVEDRVVAERKLKSNEKGKSTTYEYLPLDNPKDIRLLELQAGEPHEPLRGKLVHCSSSSDTNTPIWSLRYEALSYTWGSPDAGLSKVRDQILILSDQSTTTTLSIQPNLSLALHHLRSPSTPRLLWIDAICINQTDISERNTQVQLMPQIYSTAERVVIWLGPASQKSPDGMRVLRYLAQGRVEETPPWCGLEGRDCALGLRDVLGREWFGRMWVVQEAALSQKALLTCGHDNLEWPNDPVLIRRFTRMIKWASISPSWEQAGLAAVVNMGMFLQVLNMQMQQIERQTGRPLPFARQPDILDAAFELRHRKASDRRDMLFAVVGLVGKREGEGVVVDYGMDVEGVFGELLKRVEI